MSGVLEKHELDVLPKLELQTMDAYWRAANYLSVGQIYLYDNPLLKKPLTKEREENIQAMGMLGLLALMLLITVVDVGRFF